MESLSTTSTKSSTGSFVRFVDTSFWVAFLRNRGAHHQEARALWLANTAPLLTTNLVLGETWTFLNRREGHRAATRFIDVVGKSERVSRLRVGEDAEERAWSWLRKHDERAYSFVDATSFMVMRSERISEAFAFDGDFSAAGFIEVLSIVVA
jgi:predicted nucleic acid-binding protein